MEWLFIIGVIWYFASKFGGEGKTSSKKRSSAPSRGPTILDAEFVPKLAAWKQDISTRFDRSQWVPSSAADGYADLYPPPNWQGSPWANPVGPSTPVDLVKAEITKHNDAFLQRQKLAKKSFFDSIEKNPLTDEQVHACICMEDNVM